MLGLMLGLMALLMLRGGMHLTKALLNNKITDKVLYNNSDCFGLYTCTSGYWTEIRTRADADPHTP